MRYLADVGLIVAVSGFVSGATPPGDRDTQASANPSVDAIFADLTQPGSPGCALGVYLDGAIVYAHGYGLANLEDVVPITPQTVFDVASIAKQFTAASILLLEHKGKLRLDDAVRKYIPELPDYSAHGGPTITIRHLLNQTSGLRDYINVLQLGGASPDNVWTDGDALAAIVRQRGLVFLPGADWQYSNSNYLLLKLIVDRVSGQTLKEFAAENIFRPLNMSHTQFRDDHTSLIPHRALAYEATGSRTYNSASPITKPMETVCFIPRSTIYNGGRTTSTLVK
jgi:CubicO group peptidase (beta-lactamase class C family)